MEELEKELEIQASTPSFCRLHGGDGEVEELEKELGIQASMPSFCRLHYEMQMTKAGRGGLGMRLDIIPLVYTLHGHLITASVYNN